MRNKQPKYDKICVSSVKKIGKSVGNYLYVFFSVKCVK
jgi:hypothetical protein